MPVLAVAQERLGGGENKSRWQPLKAERQGNYWVLVELIKSSYINLEQSIIKSNVD